MSSTVGIKFLYTFTLGEYDLNNPGSNVVSVTSSRPGFDKINLTTTPLRESWRSADVSTAQEIIIKSNDLSVAPDCFSILNHNLTSLAVVQVQGSMTSNFSTPAFTINMIYTEKHMVLLQDVGVKYRYYRFRFLDPTNDCGFIEVGRIIAGKSFTFTKDEDITDEIQIAPDDLAFKTKTEGFFRASNQRVKVDKLTIKFSNLMTTTNEGVNYRGLLKLLKTVGETFPFLTIVDPNDQSFELLWGIIDNLPSRSYGVNRYATMSLALQEVY